MWIKKAMMQQGKRESLLRKIMAMALVTVLVCGVVAFFLFRGAIHLDTALRRLKYWNITNSETAGTFSFDAHNSNHYVGFNGGLAVASVGGLNTYGPDGREAVVSQGKLSLPQVEAGDKMVMAYDVGGSTLLAVHKTGGEVLRVTSDKPILDASMSVEGDICYVSSEAGYKSVLTVYNENQECVYRWLSSSTYMPLCAVSPNGEELAAIGLDEQDGSFVSTLNLFRTDSDQILSTTVLGSDLIYDLMYLHKDLICAIGESGISYLSASGEVIGTYSYNSGYLKDYDAGGDGFLALSLNTYRAGNRYSLVLVDETGVELASVYLGREILDVSAAGKYVAVLTSQGLTIYDKNLVICAETDDTDAAAAVLMRPDGTALLLGPGTGRLYIP